MVVKNALTETVFKGVVVTLCSIALFGCARLAERPHWQNMQRIDTLAAYEHYLSRYPNGKFADEAKKRIAEIKSEREAARQRKAEAYRKAISTGTIEALEQFILSCTLHCEKVAHAFSLLNDKISEVQDISGLQRLLVKYATHPCWPVSFHWRGAPGSSVYISSDSPGSSSISYGFLELRKQLVIRTGNTSQPCLIPYLIPYVDDRCYIDGAIRYLAKFSRNEWGDKHYYLENIRACWPVRDAAVEALKKCSGKDFGEDSAKWRQWWEENKDKI